MSNINYTKPNKLEDFSVWCSKKYPLWCKSNFPFIEDTFEALDTYGLICKIVQYLNETKQNLNTTEDNVQNIYDFVSNYFDNLDVQKEINNKLDEMTKTGQISDLLNAQYNILSNEVNNRIDSQNSIVNNLIDLVENSTSGSPAGVYETLEDLILANPSHNRIYVVKEDGEWYYWKSSVSNWVNGGVYQSTALGENDIDFENLNNHLSEHLLIKKIQAEIIENSYISFGGSIVIQDGYFRTNPIFIKGNQNILIKSQGYLTNVSMISSCDENGENIKSLIKSEGNLLQYYSVYLEKDSYIIFSGKLPYTNFIYTFNNLLKNEKYYVENIESITPLRIIKNDYEGFISDSYISYMDGKQVTLEHLFSSDYIELLFSDCEFKLISDKILNSKPDVRGLAFYDKNKKYISGYQYSVSNELIGIIPKNAVYMRFTYNDKTFINYSIEYTNIKQIFESFNNKINDLIYDNYPLQKIISDGGNLRIFTKMNFIGDSLTIGQFESNNTGTTRYNNFPEYGYPSIIKRILNIDIKTFARGGETTESWLNYFNNMFTDENKSEGYCIALGTNDISRLGSFTGNVSTDIDIENYNNNINSSVGNYAKIIQKIKEQEPKAKIFCFGLPNTRNSLETRTEANQKINEICNLLDCYFLDFQQYGVPVNEVSSWKSKYYNGGHLNSLGYYEFAKMVMSYINYIIENNKDDFNQIPFIGTDLSYTK